MRNEKSRAIIVGTLVAFVCSVLVSVAVVLLKPYQTQGYANERNEFIVASTGLKGDPSKIFSNLKPIIINLADGTYEDDKNPEYWSTNYMEIIKDPETSKALSSSQDIAGIKYLPNKMPAYLYYEGNKPKIAIFQTYGMGLYSTLYAYVAVDLDDLTFSGIRFWQQGETPGLGGEVTNLKWLGLWNGKQLYDKNMNIDLKFTKTPVAPSSPEASYTIDALSGATITTKGVNNMIHFWFGSSGYENFILKITNRSAPERANTPVEEVEESNDPIATIAEVAGIEINPTNLASLKPVMVNLKDGSYKPATNVTPWLTSLKDSTAANAKVKLSEKDDTIKVGSVPSELPAFIYYDNNRPSKIVLPIYGQGRNDKLYGYIGLSIPDLKVTGIKFTEHVETPWLGGKVEEPSWRAQWVGKKVYNSSMNVKFNFNNATESSSYGSNSVDTTSGASKSKNSVDALSGATITTNGVKEMLYFWLGDKGFKPFVKDIVEEASNPLLTIAEVAGIEVNRTNLASLKPVMVNLKDGSYKLATNVTPWLTSLKDSTAANAKVKLSEKDDTIKVGSVPSELPAFIYYANNIPSKIVLPIYGQGRNDKLYGYIGLSIPDLKVTGIKFTEHVETPWLGGKVEEPSWRAQWVGKKVYNSSMNVDFKFNNATESSSYGSNSVDTTSGASKSKNSVDALSGATKTTNGVKEMLYFWLGDTGFKPFVKDIVEEASNPLLSIAEVAGIEINPTNLASLKPVMVNLKDGSYKTAANVTPWLTSLKDSTAANAKVKLSDKDDTIKVGSVPSELPAFIYYDNNKPSRVVLPIYGQGRNDKLYGYIGLSIPDLKVTGIKFTEHVETPWLGGKVEEPSWRAQWVGKKVYNSSMNVDFKFNNTDSSNSVDTISGATITINGVKEMLYFWLGDKGFKNFIKAIAKV